MISHKKTPVAVLRTMLGLSVEEFAELVAIAPSSVNSIESGRLALSEKTALQIGRETGVSVAWLLNGNAKQKPYVTKFPNGPCEKYTPEEFEKIQAAKLAGPAKAPSSNELNLIWAFDTICPWLSVFYKAAQDGQADLAVWLMRQAIIELAERFGENAEAALRGAAKARITIGPKEYLIVDYGSRLGLERKGGQLSSPEAREETAFIRSRIRAVKISQGPELKSSPSPPSPGNVRHAGDRKSASPKRRRRGVPATG